MPFRSDLVVRGRIRRFSIEAMDEVTKAAGVAARQGGAISGRQLRAAGFTAERIKSWVRRGLLHPGHRGVYGFGLPVAGPDGTTHAAALAAGEDAVISHASLQVHLSLVPFAPAAKPHVTVPRRSGVTLPGIVVHRVRSLDPQDTRTIRGLRCTTPARLLLDEAERLVERDLRRLVRELKVRKLLPDGAVEAVMERGRGRRGLKLLREVWGTTSGAIARTASAPEADLLQLCRDQGLPEPLLNEPIKGLRRWWKADGFFPDAGLVVEVDSWEYHGFDDAFEDDHLKDEDLRAVGLAGLRFTAARVAVAPAEVAAAIRRELELRLRLIALGLLEVTWVD